MHLQWWKFSGKGEYRLDVVRNHVSARVWSIMVCNLQLHYHRSSMLKNKLSCFESRSNSKVSISNVDRVVTVKSYPPVSTRS